MLARGGCQPVNTIGKAIQRILMSKSLMVALAISVIGVLIGWLLGLNVWNNGWGLDLVDLALTPLVLWVCYRYTLRQRH